ncbi:MAG: hypothetical protein ACXWNE_07780 [Candidatus Binataceae bacterium]
MRCLERELDEWTRLPFDELKTRLKDVCAYERGEAPDQYQVEVEMLESTPEYVHVSIGVDSDGCDRSSRFPRASWFSATAGWKSLRFPDSRQQLASLG